MDIPALHDAASDQLIRYTPVCGASPGGFDVCLHPAQQRAAEAAASARFAALPAAARHAWLAAHLTALRGGRVSLAQIP